MSSPKSSDGLSIFVLTSFLSQCSTGSPPFSYPMESTILALVTHMKQLLLQGASSIVNAEQECSTELLEIEESLGSGTTAATQKKDESDLEPEEEEGTSDVAVEDGRSTPPRFFSPVLSEHLSVPLAAVRHHHSWLIISTDDQIDLKERIARGHATKKPPFVGAVRQFIDNIGMLIAEVFESPLLAAVVLRSQPSFRDGGVPPASLCGTLRDEATGANVPCVLSRPFCFGGFSPASFAFDAATGKAKVRDFFARWLTMPAEHHLLLELANKARFSQTRASRQQLLVETGESEGRRVCMFCGTDASSSWEQKKPTEKRKKRQLFSPTESHTSTSNVPRTAGKTVQFEQGNDHFFSHSEELKGLLFDQRIDMENAPYAAPEVFLSLGYSATANTCSASSSVSWMRQELEKKKREEQSFEWVELQRCPECGCTADDDDVDSSIMEDSGGFSPSADIWSLGVVALEYMLCAFPTDSDNGALTNPFLLYRETRAIIEHAPHASMEEKQEKKMVLTLEMYSFLHTIGEILACKDMYQFTEEDRMSEDIEYNKEFSPSQKLQEKYGESESDDKTAAAATTGSLECSVVQYLMKFFPANLVKDVGTLLTWNRYERWSVFWRVCDLRKWRRTDKTLDTHNREGTATAPHPRFHAPVKVPLELIYPLRSTALSMPRKEKENPQREKKEKVVDNAAAAAANKECVATASLPPKNKHETTNAGKVTKWFEQWIVEVNASATLDSGSVNSSCLRASTAYVELAKLIRHYAVPIDTQQTDSELDSALATSEELLMPLSFSEEAFLPAHLHPGTKRRLWTQLSGHSSLHCEDKGLLQLMGSRLIHHASFNASNSSSRKKSFICKFFIPAEKLLGHKWELPKVRSPLFAQPSALKNLLGDRPGKPNSKAAAAVGALASAGNGAMGPIGGASDGSVKGARRTASHSFSSTVVASNMAQTQGPQQQQRKSVPKEVRSIMHEVELDQELQQEGMRTCRAILDAVQDAPAATKAKALKSHIQKIGFVPSLLRAEIWGVLLQVDPPEVRSELYRQNTILAPTCNDRQIAVDVPRCHQYNPFLASPAGHEKLFRILKAWSVNNPSWIYWQGVDSLCAVVLSCAFGDEPLVFALLDKLIRQFVPHFFAANTMDHKILIFTHVLKFVSPALAQHMESIDCNPDFYAISWFLTLFAHVLPIRKVYPLWDALFLSENPNFIVCIAVAIVCHLESLLLQFDFAQAASSFSALQELPIYEIIDAAYTIARNVPPSLLNPDLVGPHSFVVKTSMCPMIDPQDIQDALLNEMLENEKEEVEGGERPMPTGPHQETTHLQESKSRGHLQTCSTHTWSELGVFIVDVRPFEEWKGAEKVLFSPLITSPKKKKKTPQTPAEVSRSAMTHRQGMTPSSSMQQQEDHEQPQRHHMMSKGTRSDSCRISVIAKSILHPAKPSSNGSTDLLEWDADTLLDKKLCSTDNLTFGGHHLKSMLLQWPTSALRKKRRKKRSSDTASTQQQQGVLENARNKENWFRFPVIVIVSGSESEATQVACKALLQRGVTRVCGIAGGVSALEAAANLLCVDLSEELEDE